MRKILQILILTIATFGFAQDGTNDGSFKPSTGTNNNVYSTAIQSDGKIIVGGDFTVLNNVACNKIGRLNVDGTLDVTFNIGSGFSNSVKAICIQPDGKIIVGGDFMVYNGASRNRIVRLNPDGTVDSSFNVGTGVNATVYSSVLQSDGKIILVGDFTGFNGGYSNYKKIIRLNADGSVDTTFNLTAANNSVYSCAIQSDGKIIIAGNFTTLNGVTRNRIARLNSDGTLDSTFNSINAANNSIKTICLQADGKIIIGGEFTSYNGASANYIARLNSDSTIDTTFNSGTGPDYFVHSIISQADGKLVIGGSFYSYNSVISRRIVRLNTDGTIDAAFNSFSVTDGPVNSLAVQSNGKLLLGGNFTSCNGVLRNRLASINANGSTDVSFYPFSPIGDFTYGHIRTMALQPDQKIIIGGYFESFNGVISTHIARLNSDGFFDTSFNAGSGANGILEKIIVLSNNKIIIGGDFTAYNGVTRNRIAQLNADGTLDTAFNSGGSGADVDVNAVAVQTDGKILIGGDFYSYNGYPRNQLARLNANGSLDTTFDPGTVIGGNIKSIAVQSDGKILVGGNDFHVGANYYGALVRLNGNGTLDTTFNVGGAGADPFVYSIAIQTDGKIIIGGSFHNYNNVSANGLARLNSNGSIDTSFDCSAVSGNFLSCVIQNDGKIITGGLIKRLNVDGTIDNTFITGTGFNGGFMALVLQNDGKIVVGGDFTYYNGIPRSKIARLNNSNTLSVDDFNTGLNINVYPNPVTDYLKFNLPDDVNVSGFEVFDLSGKKIDSNILNTNFIAVENYSAGIYFLHLKTDKGVLISKFIKY